MAEFVQLCWSHNKQYSREEVIFSHCQASPSAWQAFPFQLPTHRHNYPNSAIRIAKFTAYGTKVGSLIEFLRFSLALDGIPDYNDIIRRQFTGHLAQHSYNADQLKFLSLVQNVFLQRHRLQLADLYDAPFTSLGEDAVERLFTPEQMQAIIDLTDILAA